MTMQKDHNQTTPLPKRLQHPLAGGHETPMGASKLKDYADQIRRENLHESVVLLDNKILVGRNYYNACKEYHIPVQTREFGSDPNDGDDPKAFVARVYSQEANSEPIALAPEPPEPPEPSKELPAAETKIMEIPFEKIRLDGGTQPRAEINEVVVGDYRDDIRKGDVFPPVIVFYDGTDYWLADGFHRYRAAIDLYDECKTKDDTIEADVRQGTRRDAILFAVGANATHGERRTTTDKHRAVETLLKDKEWGKWSNNEIARRCAVSSDLVASLRKVSLSVSASDKSERTYTTKHGKQAVMNTANIGKAKAVVVEDEPPAIEPSFEVGQSQEDAIEFTPEELEAATVARAKEQEHIAKAWQSLRDHFRAWQDEYALSLRGLHGGRELIDKARKIENILALAPLYTDTERWQPTADIGKAAPEEAEQQTDSQGFVATEAEYARAEAIHKEEHQTFLAAKDEFAHWREQYGKFLRDYPAMNARHAYELMRRLEEELGLDALYTDAREDGSYQFEVDKKKDVA